VRAAGPRGRRLRSWHCVAALVVFGGLAYANSLDGAFIFDDLIGVRDNPDIRRLWSLSLLRSDWGESSLLGRPLVAATFAINYAIDGLNVRGYHIGNIVVHILCALMWFALIRRVRDSVGFAFVCASLWLLHPLNTEVVDYIGQRTESMMALFYLLTVYASVRAHTSARPGRWLAAAVVASALGTLSKQSMITVPVAVALVDMTMFYDSPRTALRSRWRFYAAIAAASWIVVAVTVAVTPPARSVGFSAGPSPWVYLLNQSVMLTRYLMLSVWPRELVVNYGYPHPYTLADVLPQMLFISGLFVLTLVALRYRPKLGLLGGWFFLTLAMTSSFAPIANEVGAERRMYLPLMALVVLGVIPFARLAAHILRAGRVSVRAVWLTCVVLWAAAATALAAGTRDRNQDYSSPLQLARIDFERWPVAYTRHALGEELLEAGRRDEALLHLREAAREDPRAHFTYGKALFAAGRWREARQELEEFVRVQPELLEVVNARAMIGQILLHGGELDAAAEQFQQILLIRRGFFDAHLGLAEVRQAQRRYEEAIVEYRAYFATGGANPAVWDQFGILLAQSGQIDAAREAFQRAVDVQPNSSEPLRHLASTLMAQGNVEATIHYAARAVTLSPGDALSRDLLGVALMAAHRRDEAIHQFREALRINPAAPDVQEHLQAALNSR
jgi:protein O-mannosyl-transferase